MYKYCQDSQAQNSARNILWRLATNCSHSRLYFNLIQARLNRVNCALRVPLAVSKIAAQQAILEQSHTKSLFFVNNPCHLPVLVQIRVESLLECSADQAKRLFSPHYRSSLVPGLYHVFNSMLNGACTLSEVVRMSSLVAVAHGDVGPFAIITEDRDAEC